MPQLKAIEIEITKKCNQNCYHCYAKDANIINEDLDKDLILNLIDKVAEHNIIDICFTGGEPFIRKDIFLLVEHAHNRGLHIWFNTNGSCLTEKVAKKLSEFKPLTIWLSINGSSPEIHNKIHGNLTSYNKVIQAMKHCRKYEIPVFASTTIVKDNLHDVQNISKLCKEMNVDTHSIDMCISTNQKISKYTVSIDEYVNCMSEMIVLEDLEYGNNELMRERFANRDDFETPCGAGHRKLAVNCNGNILPCIVMDNLIAGNTKRS